MSGGKKKIFSMLRFIPPTLLFLSTLPGGLSAGVMWDEPAIVDGPVEPWERGAG